MNIAELKIDEIKEYENNPRINDDAVNAVAESIKQFGFKVPIVVDGDNTIVAGHTRYKAAHRLGLSTVPCIVASDLTPEQIKAFRLADNKTADIAEWNNEKLLAEIKDLLNTEIDMSSFGFDMDYFNFEIESETELIQDVPPEVDFENEPKTKIGDVYILGNHRLICGDCTKSEIISRLFGDKQADLILTDPPYNMAYQGSGGTSAEVRKKSRIKNDNMSDEDFEKFLTAVYKSIESVMKNGATFYIFYKELGVGTFITALKNAGLTFKQELIWVKNQLVLGGAKYQNMYEPCLFGCKGKSIKNWYAGRKERSVIEDIDLMSEPELRIAFKEFLSDIDTLDIVRENKTVKNDLHPTMKPIKLLAKFLRNSSKKDDIVADFFGGSGSTLIACEQLNRTCYMAELDERYCDVIVKRWEDFTGRKAVKLE